MASADLKVEQTYTIAYIAHAPLEPRSAVAEWQGDRLTVWTGTQRPFGVRSELAQAMNVPEQRVRVIVPDTGAGSWLLPRLIGPSQALRLLYSGGFLEASQAKEIGYVAELVAPETLMDAARAEARRYLTSSPFSLRHMKQLVWRGLERDVADHMANHVEALQACFKSEDHKEGVASFLERRPAKFVGR